MMKKFRILLIMLLFTLSFGCTYDDSANNGNDLEIKIDDVSTASSIATGNGIDSESIASGKNADWEKQSTFLMENNYGYGLGWSYRIKEIEKDIFYISDAGIVRRNKSTGESSVIVPNTKEYQIITMEINDSIIYYGAYFNFDLDSTSKVFSSDLDGNNIELLFDGTLYKDFEWWNELTPPALGLKLIDGLHLIGSTLYINSTCSSFSYDIETKKVSGFVSDIQSSAFLGDKFYYTDHGKRTFSLYEKDLTTGKERRIKGDGKSKRNVQIDLDNTELFDGAYSLDGKLYYTRRFPPQLYQYNPDGEDVLIADFSNAKKTDTDPYIEVSGGIHKLYYINGRDVYEYESVTGRITKLVTLVLLIA